MAQHGRLPKTSLESPWWYEQRRACRGEGNCAMTDEHFEQLQPFATRVGVELSEEWLDEEKKAARLARRNAQNAREQARA